MQSWNLCSEKLPRKYDEVLVSVAIKCDEKWLKNVLFGRRISDGWDVCDTNDSETVFDNDDEYKVIAWMPLPLAYGEE